MDLVAKILSPTRPLKARGRVYWVRQNIPYELKLKAEVVQQQVLDDFRFFGMLKREFVPHYAPLPIKELDAKIRELKLNLFQKYPDSFLMGNIRGELKTATRQLNEAYSIYSSLDSVTLESYAEKRASLYIMRQLTKTPYGIAELLLYDSMRKAVTISQIRKVARSDSWQNLYSARNPFRHFPLTDEQIALASFTQLYRNVNKHPESPEPAIIEDDDLLDGWLIWQSKNVKKKETSFGKKIDSAKEVFIMAQGQEHADEIYKNNSDEARAIQNVRMKQLKQEGKLPYGKLKDVKYAQR